MKPALHRAALFVAGLMACGLADAAGVLTLETVLAAAEAPHPQLDLAQAQAAAAEAEAELADSLDDFQLSLEGSLRSGRNAYYHDRFHPDHQIRLTARKRLLDAGRTSLRAAAAGEEAAARGLYLRDAAAQRRVSLMARYFDVLLADMQYNADTEFMAVSYVSWDNGRDRHALGQLPQTDLQELDARYRADLARRNDTRRLLRDKRMQLAIALNRDTPVQEDLADPRLADNDRPLPELPALLAHAETHNPRLAAQHNLLAAAQSRRDAARADYRPSLELEAEAAGWSRNASTRDELRAGLNFIVPLWQGGRQDASTARETARIAELRAQTEQMRQQLREDLRALVEEIDYLRGSARQEAQIHAQWREQALDKARAEYEMELKTNLGTSMAETQAAQIRLRRVEYRLALALARLEALLGGPLSTVATTPPTPAAAP